MFHTTILWFRRDLRLDDNPALTHALTNSARIIPVYIHAPDDETPWAPGAASRWWLHQSLLALDQSLRDLGTRLWIARGDSLTELRRIIAATGATQAVWNRLYDPATRERDTLIKQALRTDGLHCDSFNAALLFEPWQIANASGQPYRVFSAFWRTCVRELPRIQTAAPAPLSVPAGADLTNSLNLADLDLLPRIRWDQGLRETWTPGAAAALQQAATFLDTRVAVYGEARDRPDQPGTSRLSPALHFGEISPRRLLAMVVERHGDPTAAPVEHFVRELGWREFSYHLLYHFPQTPSLPLDGRFADFRWRTEGADALLDVWQHGQTGIPLVDAGMRELWHTGWMHNRVRMVVASLLTKHLRLPWQLGAQWFWETLVDADLACNTQGWQWTAGCGADAAPYFRIFNPVRQGERFDPDGDYVRRWCPELARLPGNLIQQPWTASPPGLSAAGVRLGDNYPLPVVDLAVSRRDALAAWDILKGNQHETG